MILVDILVSSYLLTAPHPATRLIFSVALSVAETLLARLGAEMRHFTWQWFSIVSFCEVMTTHHQQGLMKISGLGQAEAVGQRERTLEGRSRSECGQFSVSVLCHAASRVPAQPVGAGELALGSQGAPSRPSDAPRVVSAALPLPGLSGSHH